MNFSTLTQQCVRRFNDALASLQKQAPSAKMIGKFAVDQAVREARKVVVRPTSTEDPPHE